MSYWYGKETNNYAQQRHRRRQVQLRPGGYLTRIDYGTCDRRTADRYRAHTTPSAQVVFDTADRCFSSCASRTDAAHWPDTPWDQECTASATACPGNYSPTFWTTKRLKKITTRVWDTTQTTPGVAGRRLLDVDAHASRRPGDAHPRRAVAGSIEHTGLVGGSVTLPPVTFERCRWPNRVLTATRHHQQLVADRDHRHRDRRAGSRSTTRTPECTAATCRPGAGDQHQALLPGDRCPTPATRSGTAWTSPSGGTSTSSRMSPRTTCRRPAAHPAPTKNTCYTYVGDAGLALRRRRRPVQADRKTWDQWRGYADGRHPGRRRDRQPDPDRSRRSCAA